MPPPEDAGEAERRSPPPEDAGEAERRSPPPPPAPTVRGLLATATERLERAGCDTPRLDAELLLAEVLGVDRARLVIDARRSMTDDQALHFGRLVDRRAAREPVAYILGRRDFRRLTLRVDRRVLIPRPETELLVEVGLNLARGARVIDVGTGSGAIALALADERPDLEVVGSDVSREAVAVARDNAARLGLVAEFVVGDLLDGVPGPFDAVLANLPYVRTGDQLPPDVGDYEPPGALFAGDDGLAEIRRLIAQAAGVPLLALELDPGQIGRVAGWLRDAGFTRTEVQRDLAGHERVVVGRR